MTTLGDLIAENTVPTAARVAGNTTATKNFLSQTGTGSASALPVWGTIASGDIPASVALTGTPTAPTAAALTDSTQIATTAYTDSAVAVETTRAETAEGLVTGNLTPADCGALAWTFNPGAIWSVNQLHSLTAGAPYTWLFVAGATGTIGHLTYTVTTAESGFSGCYFGIYNSAGTLISGPTADQGGHFGTIGQYTAAYGSGAPVVAGQLYYSLLLCSTNGATFPVFAGPAQGSSAYPGAGLAGAGLPMASVTGVTGLSTLPTSFTTANRSTLSIGMVQVFNT